LTNQGVTGSPVQIAGLSGVTQIVTASSTDLCAIVANGAVMCVGIGSSGRLGNGSTSNRTTVDWVSSLTGATQLSSMSGAFCALLSDHTLKCWGQNTSGYLGDGSVTNRLIPTKVYGISAVSSLANGAAAGAQGRANFQCAAMQDGTVKCWGNNSDLICTGAQ